MNARRASEALRRAADVEQRALRAAQLRPKTCDRCKLAGAQRAIKLAARFGRAGYARTNSEVRRRAVRDSQLWGSGRAWPRSSTYRETSAGRLRRGAAGDLSEGRYAYILSNVSHKRRKEGNIPSACRAHV